MDRSLLCLFEIREDRALCSTEQGILFCSIIFAVSNACYPEYRINKNNLYRFYSNSEKRELRCLLGPWHTMSPKGTEIAKLFMFQSKHMNNSKTMSQVSKDPKVAVLLRNKTRFIWEDLRRNGSFIWPRTGMEQLPQHPSYLLSIYFPLTVFFCVVINL